MNPTYWVGFGEIEQDDVALGDPMSAVIEHVVIESPVWIQEAKSLSVSDVAAQHPL